MPKRIKKSLERILFERNWKGESERAERELAVKKQLAELAAVVKSAPRDDPNYLVQKFDAAVARGEQMRKDGAVTPEMKQAWKKFNNKIADAGLTPEEIANAVKTGVLSINEARAILGYAPLPDGEPTYLFKPVIVPAPVEKEPEPEASKPKIITRKLEM